MPTIPRNRPILVGLAVAAAPLALLAPSCASLSPADADEAGEAVVRHLAERNFGAYPEPPWDVVCLGRRDTFPGGPEDAFLRRFEGSEPVVMPADRCVPAGEDDHRWIVDGTGPVGLEIQLREARRRGEGLHVEALASGGPIDFTVYECSLVRDEAGWRVEECLATVMT
jgi:hypothetical protein